MKLIFLILSIFTTSLNAQRAQEVYNRALDQDLKLCVNDDGVKKCPVQIDGPTGDVSTTGTWTFGTPLAGSNVGVATTSNYGVVRGGEVPGGTGAAVATGKIGETLYGTITAGAISSGASWYSLTNIALTPGTWMLSGYVRLEKGTATFTTPQLAVAWSHVSGTTNPTPQVFGITTVGNALDIPTGFLYHVLPAPTVTIIYNGTTVTFPNGSTMTLTSNLLHLKAYVEVISSGAAALTGYIQATKI